jgi:hypothetical protein
MVDVTVTLSISKNVFDALENYAKIKGITLGI